MIFNNMLYIVFFSIVATTGPSVYYNQSPAYNSQYLLRTAANVTPTKVICHCHTPLEMNLCF